MAPEAIVPPQPIMTETAKTFDLDAMLGTTPAPTPTPTPMIMPEVTKSPLDKGGNEGGFVTQASQPIFEIPKAPTRLQTPASMPAK